MKFRKGVPIPYPVGEAWNKLKIVSNSDKKNGNQLGSIHADRMQKIYSVIDAAESKIIDDFALKSSNIKPESIGDGSNVIEACAYATSVLTNAEWNIAADRLTICVAQSLSTTGEFIQEELKSFVKLPAPKNPEEAATRPDAKLWAKAEEVELAAFDKFNVMKHDLTMQQLKADGITGRPIPPEFIYSVKLNDDGSYQKHKARLILKGHKGYITAGRYDETVQDILRFLQALQDVIDVDGAMVPNERRHGHRAAIILPVPPSHQQVLEDRKKKYQEWYNVHGDSDSDSDSDSDG